jgi:hypothetical protein
MYPSPWGEGRAKRAGEGLIVRVMKLDGTTTNSGIPIPIGDWIELLLQHEREGIHIDKRTAATRWTGEKCDYGMGVEALLHAAPRSHVAQTETLTLRAKSRHRRQ